MSAPVNVVAPNLSAGVGNIGTSGGTDQISWGAGVTNILGKKLQVSFYVLQLGTNTTISAGQTSAPSQDFTFSPTLGLNTFTFTVGHVNEPVITFNYGATPSQNTILTNFQVTDATPIAMASGKSISAVTATYTITRPNSVLGISLPVTPKTYAITSFNVKFGIALPATVKTLAVTTPNVIFDIKQPFTTASYAFAFPDTTLTKVSSGTQTLQMHVATFNVVFSRTQPVITQSYATTTPGVILNVGLPTQSCAYVLSRQTAQLTKQTGVTLTRTLAITTPSVSFRIAHRQSAFTTPYVLTRSVTVLQDNHKLALTATTFSAVGPDVTFSIGGVDVILGVPVLTLGLTTFSASLDYFKLSVSVCNYTLTSPTMMPTHGRSIVPTTATYSVSAPTAVLSKVNLLKVNLAAYSLTGFTAGAHRAFVEINAVKSCSLTLEPAFLKLGTRMLAVMSQLSLTPENTALSRLRSINFSPEAIAATGGTVSFTVSRFLYFAEQTYVLSGVDISSSFGRGIGSISGTDLDLTLQGFPAKMLRGKGFAPGPFIYTIDPAVALIYGPSPPAPSKSNRRIKLKAQNRTVVISTTQ